MIYPQVVICTGKVDKRAVVVTNEEDKDEIVIRSMLTAIFTYDHRFGDASLSLKFLKIIKDYVEDPENFNIDKYPDSPPWYEQEKYKKK